jgi:hypothetical protein
LSSARAHLLDEGCFLLPQWQWLTPATFFVLRANF